LSQGFRYKLTSLYPSSFWDLKTWPSGKFPFECQKIAKNCHFFQKNCQWQFFGKKDNFYHFFSKQCLESSFWQFFINSNVNFLEGQLKTGKCPPVSSKLSSSLHWSTGYWQKEIYHNYLFVLPELLMTWIPPELVTSVIVSCIYIYYILYQNENMIVV